MNSDEYGELDFEECGIMSLLAPIVTSGKFVKRSFKLAPSSLDFKLQKRPISIMQTILSRNDCDAV